MSKIYTVFILFFFQSSLALSIACQFEEVYKNGHYGLDGSWWDGKNTHQYDQLAPGVYFYVLKVGNKVTQKEDVYKGMINLFY